MDKEFIIAAAGSRKTTHLVEEALKDTTKRTLITTYTIENAKQINDYIVERVGLIPRTLQILTWYSFLLRDCVKPYQNFIYADKRISNIYFVEGKSAPFIPRKKVKEFYFQDGERIYTDKIADFACSCDQRSEGLVIRRLEEIYDQIFIDESQDLAGYDLDLLELLLGSTLRMVVVGDCRQSIYYTHYSQKNSRYRGYNIFERFKDWERRNLCTVIEKNESYRCNQQICNLADRLYPELNATISKKVSTTGHEGIFIVSPKDVNRYFEAFGPAVLRDSVKTPTMGLPAINFGMAKGRTYDRVLIFPNGPILNYLYKGDCLRLKQKTKAGFYIAVTRARHSVAFVCDELPLGISAEAFR